jgi:hypothetical protein
LTIRHIQFPDPFDKPIVARWGRVAQGERAEWPRRM